MSSPVVVVVRCSSMLLHIDTVYTVVVLYVIRSGWLMGESSSFFLVRYVCNSSRSPTTLSDDTHCLLADPIPGSRRPRPKRRWRRQPRLPRFRPLRLLRRRRPKHRRNHRGSRCCSRRPHWWGTEARGRRQRWGGGDSGSLACW